MQKPHLYTSRPRTVEAMRFDGDNDDAIFEWTDTEFYPLWHGGKIVWLRSCVTDQNAGVGDWIVRLGDNEFRVYDEAAFLREYDGVLMSGSCPIDVLITREIREDMQRYGARGR